MIPVIVGLGKCGEYSFSKSQVEFINVVEGMGVEGDVHAGEKVKHRSRVRRDPNQPNLRQVHLIHAELFEELREKGFHIKPGDVGENITTQGVNLLELPTGTLIKVGSAVLRVTGLRNPCSQLDHFQDGLLQAVLDKDEEGNLIRKCGIMSVVEKGGTIQLGDQIELELPAEPRRALEPV